MVYIFEEIRATQYERPAILENLADEREILRKLVLPIGEGRVERGEGGSADIHAEFGVEASIGRNRLRGQLVGQFIFDLAVDAVIVDLVVVRAACVGQVGVDAAIRVADHITRSEEHTSELQSLMRISYAVFCLIKKKH